MLVNQSTATSRIQLLLKCAYNIFDVCELANELCLTELGSIASTLMSVVEFITEDVILLMTDDCMYFSKVIKPTTCLFLCHTYVIKLYWYFSIVTISIQANSLIKFIELYLNFIIILVKRYVNKHFKNLLFYFLQFCQNESVLTNTVRHYLYFNL